MTPQEQNTAAEEHAVQLVRSPVGLQRALWEQLHVLMVVRFASAPGNVVDAMLRAAYRAGIADERARAQREALADKLDAVRGMVEP